MKDTWQELARQPTDSGNDAYQTLVHSSNNESLAQRTKRLVDISDYNPAADSVGDKLVREAQVLTWGMGEAFGGAVANPLSKAPELATAGAFGVGMKVLQKGGTSGKAVAGVIGAGMVAKMGYDELTGNRWSEFGHAMGAAWHSKADLDSSIEATKNSVGSLAVDLAVGSLAFRGTGAREPVTARSVELTRGSFRTESMPLMREHQAVFEVSKFSLRGERSLALVESPLPLRRFAHPTRLSETGLPNERWSTQDNVQPRIHDLRAGSQAAKPIELLDGVPQLPKMTLADGLKSKLLSGRLEEFGYLSAIREIAAVETAPGFRPSREAYESIATALRLMAKDADREFSLQYQEVALLVEQHARAQLEN